MIRFDAENHLYFNEKGFIVPSVTEVLGAVYGTGLEGAPAELVARAAEKGSAVHKEIEAFIKTKDAAALTLPEALLFGKYAETHLRLNVYAVPEVLLHAVTPHGEIAGTADLFCYGWLYDYKTSKTATREQVKKWQMQLSVYRFILQSQGRSVLGMKVLHLTKDACQEIELEYLGDAFVLETLRKYAAGETVQPQPPATDLQTVDARELNAFAHVVMQIKQLEASIAPVREAIKNEMEQRGILTLEIGGVRVSYVAPTTRQTFDSARFKKDHADLYNQYQKESTVKSSVRISL